MAEREKMMKKAAALGLSAAVLFTTAAGGAGLAYAASKKDSAKLSYKGYKLQWEDDFNGDKLNRDDWNVELHDPGWVNAELQEYVDSEENIQVKDGKLVISPVQVKNEDGTYSYTSGRVNTQNKHDFKYGLFEAKVKVPEGAGYLPAFWMMPTDENVYGQWPKCGEIDCMEVMGQETDLAYGTVHFGEPHSERQGTYRLSNGSFSDGYHLFSCEWEPGSIKWYIDGKLFHSANDWYSTTANQGTVTYPAPFDQPFYIILNLAVGGSWVGYPDDATFKAQPFEIDYVKVYQKSKYDENVKKPVKEVTIRKPDKDGNYIKNGDFSRSEKLDDGKNWEFMTAQGGDASASIKGGAIKVKTANEGTVDYSVQLVQAGIPLEKGATYEVAFDASAGEARTIGTAIKAPDFNYMEYMPAQTVELTTKKKHYSYSFQMGSDTDANGRIEFNMGAAGSAAPVTISNVSVKKTKDADPNAKEEKTVRADGNYVYNGGFQEGEGRLGYWDVKKAKGAAVSVTNKNLRRELKVKTPKTVKSLKGVTISQEDLPITGGKEYTLSFRAYAAKAAKIKVRVAGRTFTASLGTGRKTYKFSFKTPKDIEDKGIKLLLGVSGNTVYVDDVRLAESGMIINGDFAAGIAGYEEWNDAAAKVANFGVDSLNEDSAFTIEIDDTGSEAWHIQLKQNNVTLEKGQGYKLTFDAKSTVARQINAKFQRDGSSDDNWDVYGEKTVGLKKGFQTYELEFVMEKDTDKKSILDFEFGAVGGEQIAKNHVITIDNIKLEKVK